MYVACIVHLNVRLTYLNTVQTLHGDRLFHLIINLSSLIDRLDYLMHHLIRIIAKRLVNNYLLFRPCLDAKYF